MTVEELIDKLRACDPQTEVICWDPDEECGGKIEKILLPELPNDPILIISKF